MDLPKTVETCSGPMNVRAWAKLERTGELLVDLGTNGVPGNGYQNHHHWYIVDNKFFPRYDPGLRYGDTVTVIKKFDDWKPQTNCGCI